MSDYISPDPDLDDARTKRLQYDLAIGILPINEVAVRYGFSDGRALLRYFEERPGLVTATEKLKSLFESERSPDERTKAKALQATEELIPPVFHIARDPRVAPQQRIDAFKQLTRVAGVDGSSAAAALKAGGGGTPFTLNILFQGRPPERLEMTPDPPPPPIEHVPSGGRSTISADPSDDEFDEEV